MCVIFVPPWGGFVPSVGVFVTSVRSVLPLFALSAALAAPSTPVINSPGNGSRFVEAQTVNAAFTFWRQRTRSITWRVYDNGAERCSGSVGWDLTTNAVNRGCPV